MTEGQSAGEPDTQAPTAPSAPRFVGAGSDYAVVHVTDNQHVRGYQLFVDGLPRDRSFRPMTQYGGPANIFFEGLTPRTTCSITLKTFDIAGNFSPPSAALSLTTLGAAAPADTEPPSRPSSFACAGYTATSVSLKWLASTDNYVVRGYLIFQNGTYLTMTTGTTYTADSLLSGTAYSFVIQAVDVNGLRSVKPNALQVRTPGAATLKLLSPNGGEQFHTGDTMRITWQAGTGLATTDVLLSLDNGKTSTMIAPRTIRAGDDNWLSWAWVVPTNIPGPGGTVLKVEGTQCRIVVTDYDETCRDESDMPFSIAESSTVGRQISPYAGGTAASTGRITRICVGLTPLARSRTEPIAEIFDLRGSVRSRLNQSSRGGRSLSPGCWIIRREVVAVRR